MSDRFLVTARLPVVYELQYREYSWEGASEAPLKTEAFASEEDARAWYRSHNVHVESFSRVEKLEW